MEVKKLKSDSGGAIFEVTEGKKKGNFVSYSESLVKAFDADPKNAEIMRRGKSVLERLNA